MHVTANIFKGIDSNPDHDSTPALFPELYHPFVITNDDLGGYWRMPKDGSRRKKTKIYAGVKYTFRGIPQVSRTINQFSVSISKV